MATEITYSKVKTQLLLIMMVSTIFVVSAVLWETVGNEHSPLPLWAQWVILLFLFAFAIGVIGPLSGVGGGVIFVGLGMAILPFHVDFIRGAGLVAALTTSLSSAPHFAERGLANIRIAAPLVVVSTVFSVIGSIVGLWVSDAFPNGSSYVKISLGIVLLILLAALATSKNVEYPEVKKKDKLAELLSIRGAWYEPTLKSVVEYQAANLPIAMVAFAGVGFIAGMFGLGAGWANVPILNLVMGIPLKVSVATSMLILAINDSASLWVYLANGAVLPVIVIPVILGIGIGSRIGSRLAVKTKPKMIKYLVIGLIGLSAVVNVIQGLIGIGVL